MLYGGHGEGICNPLCLTPGRKQALKWRDISQYASALSSDGEN